MLFLQDYSANGENYRARQSALPHQRLELGIVRLAYDYGTQKIEFDVIYRKRRTLSIEVGLPGVVKVIAPARMTEREIIEIVKGKSKWITQKLFEICEMEHKKRKREFVNGESLIYMGRNYSLQIILDEKVSLPEAKLIRGKLVVTSNTKDQDAIKLALEHWYRDKAKEKINERIEYYQAYFDVKPKKVVIKNQVKRWGSCTQNRHLLFNWKCIMAPSPVIDYIVVHEMCHMVHMNHSAEFWGLLKRILPDYESRKELLKNNGVKYDL